MLHSSGYKTIPLNELFNSLVLPTLKKAALPKRRFRIIFQRLFYKLLNSLLQGENERTEFNQKAHPISLLFSRGHRIESTKRVPLLAFIIGSYCIFHTRDPNEILMKYVVAFCPIRIFCRKKPSLDIIYLSKAVFFDTPL